MHRKSALFGTLAALCVGAGVAGHSLSYAAEPTALDAAGSAKKSGSAARLGAQTFMVPMSDGKKLATDVYMPRSDGPFPVIMMRTPYDKTKGGSISSAATLVPQGYAFVAQDMRGRFASEGQNMPFIGDGWGEHKDGVDTIEWLLKQPWCNGKIGTTGASASGITQNMLAGAAPRGLVAQYIVVAPTSSYHHASYLGGALLQSQAVGWTTENGFEPQAIETLLAHPTYDEAWYNFDTSRKFDVMNVPAIHVGGWFDTFEQGTIDSFRGRQHHGAPGARGTQMLVIGPWDHGSRGRSAIGGMSFPNSTPPPQYDSLRWFDYHLKGIENGMMKEPAVCYYVMGDTSGPKAPGNEWRTAADWPVPATDTPFFFGKSGALAPEKPTGSATDAFVQYVFDPANPCQTIGGRNLNLPKGPLPQNPIESRSDVAVFTTPPLTEPVEVTGQVFAKLFVSSSALDTDLSVRLCDVYPDGKSCLFSEGMLRLRYRNSFEKPQPLTPGEITPVTVDCWATSLVFNKGHRIRVTVTSSNYPRFDVNPGNGMPRTASRPAVKQTNRIYFDAEHPSSMVLPIVAKAK